MKHVILCKGLPACGKSTWCQEQIDHNPGKYKRVSKDDLRRMLDNDKWSKGNEKFVLQARNALILSALQAGYHVLVDDTNLHSKHEQHIRELVKGLATVEIQDFTHVPLDVCIERDRKRANYVGEQTIRRMYRDFLQSAPPVPVYNPLLMDAVISDLDGTLALMNGRNPYDASLCEQDTPNASVVSLVRMAHSTAHVLLVSGRKECHRPQTQRWLQQHGIPYEALWMRVDDDNRKDVLVKHDIYEQHIRGKYNILYVVDDRKQVVDFWRSQGLTCLQVAEGDF